MKDATKFSKEETVAQMTVMLFLSLSGLIDKYPEIRDPSNTESILVGVPHAAITMYKQIGKKLNPHQPAHYQISPQAMDLCAMGVISAIIAANESITTHDHTDSIPGILMDVRKDKEAN